MLWLAHTVVRLNSMQIVLVQVLTVRSFPLEIDNIQVSQVLRKVRNSESHSIFIE